MIMVLKSGRKMRDVIDMNEEKIKINVQMKTPGKRRPILGDVPYEISDTVKTPRDLLTELVEIEVERYNQKGVDVQLLPFLSEEELKEQVVVGKVGFGRIYSEKKADVARAVENAIQCFEDGLVRVFCGERELEQLDEEIELKEGDELTFIRLTFLTGRMW